MNGEDTNLPSISVVVCTRDRPQMLGRCLRALRELSYPTFEVVVVDNASSDARTREEAMSSGFDRVRYVFEPTPGLDWARNRGVAEARYDLIAFTDDDVEVTSTWLTALAAAFSDPAVDGVTGLILPAECDTPAQRWFEAYGNGMRKGLTPRRWSGRTLTAVELMRAQDVGVGASMAFRRAALDLIGGFDTALDVGTASQGGGDLDLFHRLLVADHTIQYEPSAVVRHHHRRETEALRRQLYANGRAYGAYLRKVYASGRIPRGQVLRFSAGWMRWLVGRSVRAIFTSRPLPRSLVWAELRGAWDSGRAWREALAEDARRRQQRAEVATFALTSHRPVVSQ